MRQYMFSLPSDVNNTFITIWYPVMGTIKPKIADQLALGYTNKISKLKSMVTLEMYYTKTQNLLEYKEEDIVVSTTSVEDQLVSGKGDSYGVECTVETILKRLTGFVSYSLSKSTRHFTELNLGRTYPATGDRRHNLSLLMTYAITKHWACSALWIYGTGRRFTPLEGAFLLPNATMTQYDVISFSGEKNSAQLPSSHRLDINLIWRSANTKKWKSE